MTKRRTAFSLLATIAMLVVVSCAGTSASNPVQSTSPPPSPENETGVQTLEPLATETPLTIMPTPAETSIVPTKLAPDSRGATPVATVASSTRQAATPTAEAIAPPMVEDFQPGPAGLLGMDYKQLTALVMGSPEVLDCANQALGFATLMQLTQREPTQEEINLLLPCLEDAQSAAPVSATPAPTPKAVQEPRYERALTAPEGIPWYDGPLFDSHMHMIGLTIPYFGDIFTTTDVIRLMDRHDIQGGVGFFMPPVTGGQSEVAAVLQSIEDLESRLVTLMMPPPFDFGFPFGFMGFAEGSYTRQLLEPWYPPQGPFDGFGEIPFYVDHLSSMKPGDWQLQDVYPLIAEVGGVVMIHPDSDQTAEAYAEVILQYPEITSLFHGSKDFYGTGADEQHAILELLSNPDLDNVYYTLDMGSIMHVPEYDGSVLMQPDNAEEFLGLMDSVDVQEFAQRIFDNYGEVVIDHPDKTLWGTDLLSSWHFEDAAHDVLMDFSRRFIAMLPEEIQGRFAVENGQRVFGHYLD